MKEHQLAAISRKILNAKDKIQTVDCRISGLSALVDTVDDALGIMGEIVALLLQKEQGTKPNRVENLQGWTVFWLENNCARSGTVSHHWGLDLTISGADSKFIHKKTADIVFDLDQLGTDEEKARGWKWDATKTFKLYWAPTLRRWVSIPNKEG